MRDDWQAHISVVKIELKTVLCNYKPKINEFKNNRALWEIYVTHPQRAA